MVSKGIPISRAGMSVCIISDQEQTETERDHFSADISSLEHFNQLFWTAWQWRQLINCKISGPTRIRNQITWLRVHKCSCYYPDSDYLVKISYTYINIHKNKIKWEVSPIFEHDRLKQQASDDIKWHSVIGSSKLSKQCQSPVVCV